MLFPIGYDAQVNEYKIAEFARMGLMPSGLPHNMWRRSVRPDNNGIVEIDALHRDGLASPDQQKFRRWSRRLNGQDSNGTGWVLKPGEQTPGSWSPSTAPHPSQDQYPSAYYPDQRSASYESRFSSSPCSDGPSSSGNSPPNSFDSYECPRGSREFHHDDNPHRYFDPRFNDQHYSRQRSKSHGPPQRSENGQQLPNAWSPRFPNRWRPRSERKRRRFRQQPGTDAVKSQTNNMASSSQQSVKSPPVNSSSPQKSPSKTRSSVKKEVPNPSRSNSPATDQSKSQENGGPSCADVIHETATAAAITRKMASPGKTRTKIDEEVMKACKRTPRKSELERLILVDLPKKREASSSPEKTAKKVKASPSKNKSSRAEMNFVPNGFTHVIRVEENPNSMRDGDRVPPLKIKLIKTTEMPKEMNDTRVKAKKKKRKRSKRKSKSPSKRKTYCSEIITSPPSISEKSLDATGGKALLIVSPSKCSSSHYDVITILDEAIETSSPKREIQTTETKGTESPSKTCGAIKAPVFFGSGQVKDESAISNFPRAENLETPKVSGVKKSEEVERQSRTANVAKQSKLCPSRRSSSCDVQILETPTETTTITKPGGNQKAPGRPSPSKAGDFKPKALIKPGLRSVNKERGSATKRRSKTPPKCESERKLVQKTLESYFKSVDAPMTEAVEQQSDPAMKGVKAAPRSTRKSSNSKDASASHVRRIYQDEDTCRPTVETRRAVVRLNLLPEETVRKPRNTPAAALESRSPGPAPGGRWAGATRLAQVPPTPSPAKATPTPAEALKTSPVKPSGVAAAPLPPSIAVVPLHPAAAGHPEGHPEEELARKEEAARAVEAAQRNEKRHNSGRKVIVFCPVLLEHIERHPVQNEIPANKWSKWLNPTQLRCLISAMLDNTELCLGFSLESDCKKEWEEAWVGLGRRLNGVCFNSLTNLNTGLRMTVAEWKVCWVELKARVQQRLDAMTPKERVHNLGSLECLLFSKDLYSALMTSKGECLGDECPRKWCSGACVGVFSPAESAMKSRGTEE